MPRLLSENELKSTLEAVLSNGDNKETNIEGIKYDFTFGKRFLKSHFVVPRNYDELSNEELKYAFVEPGEVVFVLSKERVKLPNDIYIQLSPKRSLAQDGIELLGGLTVDPSYEGLLVFGLYNVSGTPYRLTPGIKLVGANFFRLFEEEIPKKIESKPKAIYDFPDRLQQLIEKYKPVNPQTISDELKQLQNAFDDSQSRLNQNIQSLNEIVMDMRRELTNETVKREQEGIRISSQLTALERRMESLNDSNIRHEQSLLALKDGIKDIKEDLKDEIRNLKTDINQVEQTFHSIKTWAKVLGALMTIVGGIIGGVTTGFFERLLGL